MLRRIFHFDRLQKPSSDLFQGVPHALRDPKEGPNARILHDAKLQVETQLSRFRYTQAAFDQYQGMRPSQSIVHFG